MDEKNFLLVDEEKLFDFHSKREVAENFSLDELLKFTRRRNLQKWLSENFYSGETRKLLTAVDNQLNDTELKLLLCKIFDLSIENLSAEELAEISSAVDKNHRRELFMKQNPDDDRNFFFVETQGELVKALRDGAKFICLCGGEFRIPLNLNGVTYVGCDNAIIDFDSDTDVDLDAKKIVLEDVQLYLHHAINLRAEKSTNVKIIDGSKKFLDEQSPKKIFDILRGRGAFESPVNFMARAESVHGAAVGTVLLEEKNFDFSKPQFNFKPRWDFEYISVLKDFVAGKNFSVRILPADAENLYTNERKLQIFADFTCRDGKLTILNLYFATKTLGKIMIETTLPEKKTLDDENFSVENFSTNEIVSDGEKVTADKNISADEKISVKSSCPFGFGYGLNIITAYDDANLPPCNTFKVSLKNFLKGFQQ